MNYLKIASEKIKKKKIVIGVIGLGYVGLPLAILFSKRNFVVYGFDINKKKIDSIKKCKSYIKNISKKDIFYLTKDENNCFDKMENLRLCDIIIICVPTPLKKNNLPDLSFIKNAFSHIKKYMKYGQTIILESTSYPGTTEEIIIQNLDSKYKVGKNIFIGFSSERINPGLNENSINKIPKVISGFSNNCKNVIKLFYSKFFDTVVLAKTLKIAEFSKLLENIYRSVNISFMNEMKLVADKMKIDIFEIIKIAETKPFGYIPYNPGPGTGGHCIPIDPHYMYWKAKKSGIRANFIKLSVDTNYKVINFIFLKLKKILKKINKRKMKILLLGMSYKPNIDDTRESGTIKLAEKLLKDGFKNLHYYDPFVKSLPNENKKLKINKLKKLKSEYLKKFDITVLMTDHDIFDYKMILKNSKMILDCRGRYSVSEKVYRA